MDQSERWPDRMIASQNEAVAGAAQDRLHAASIRLDACGVRIVKAATVYRAPEIRIQFEIRAPPFAAHRSKERLEVFLNFRMRSVQHVPWSVSPAAKRDRV